MISDAVEDAGSPEAKGIPGASSIGREMAKGSGWMIAARLGVQAIGLVSTIILARILVPADFGLVALATTFAAALQAISEFSFDVVLIQNQRAGREHYDTAWTLSVIRNSILALCLGAGAPLIAPLLGDPRLTPIVYFLAFSTFVDGLQNIGIVDFRKHLAFHRELVFMVVGKLGMFLVTVPLAFLWRDYWALVAGLMAGAIVRLALSYLMHPFRPRLCLTHWREIMHFSKWLLLNNIFGFVANRSDTFVIGKLAGAQAVGIYGIAFEIANLTTSNLVGPLRRAIFPGYSKVSENIEGLRHGVLTVMAVVLLIGTPTTIGVGAVAAPLVHFMLGEQWIGSIPLIRILSLYGFLALISTSSGPIFLATARPQYLMYILSGSTIIMLPLLIFGVHYANAAGAAWAITVTAALAVVVDFWLMTRVLKLAVRPVLSIIWRPIAAVSAMVAATSGIEVALEIPRSAAGWAGILASEVITGAVVYTMMSIILWVAAGRPSGAETYVLSVLRLGLRRLDIAQSR